MVLTSNLPARQPSRAAMWSLRLAVFLPVLAALSVLGHRGAFVDTPTFLILIVVIGVLLALALLLFAIGMRSLWLYGMRGGRRLSWAMLLMLPLIAAYAWAGVAWISHPALTDVSTDLVDPPLFSSEIARAGANATALVAGDLIDGYPELVGQRFSAPLDVVDEQVRAVANRLGWRLAQQRGRIGADDAILLQYEHQTPILRMPVQLVVRSTDEGDTIFIDVRSRMPYVAHDLGHNARLVRRFLFDLDFAMIGVAEPQP